MKKVEKTKTQKRCNLKKKKSMFIRTRKSKFINNDIYLHKMIVSQ